MFTTLINFLDKNVWHYTKPEEDKTILILGFEGQNGKFQCICDVQEDNTKFICYTIFGNNIQEERLLSVCEYITRVNSITLLGNFELDFNDCEVRYKTSMDYESIVPTETLIEHLILANIITMDTYLPGLMKVIYSNVSAKQAFDDSILFF